MPAETHRALPPLQQGQIVHVDGLEVVEKETQPPRPFDDATLLNAMKHAGRDIDDDALAAAMKTSGLGTPATRAEIIEKLLRTGYIERQRKQLRATDKGKALIGMVAEPLRSVETTAAWEQRLKDVEQGSADAAAFYRDICALDRRVDPASRSGPGDERRAGGRGQGRKPRRDGSRWCGCGQKARCRAPARRGKAIRPRHLPDLQAGRDRRDRQGLRMQPLARRLRLYHLEDHVGKAPGQGRGQTPDRAGQYRSYRRIQIQDRQALQRPPAVRQGRQGGLRLRAQLGKRERKRQSRQAGRQPDHQWPIRRRPRRLLPEGPAARPATSPADSAPSGEPPASAQGLRDHPLQCPKCRQGHLIEGRHAFGCNRWRDGCDFVVPKQRDGHAVTDSELRALIQQYPADPI